jgi:hypothetical protein
VRSTTRRQRLIRLVQELPDSELTAAERYLTYLRNMGDPLVRTIAASPYDDEPVTPEEQASVQRAMEDIAAGRVIPHEEVAKPFCLQACTPISR